MQVDWKKVEKDVNKAKKHLKKKANKAAPEINTFIEEVKVPGTKLALSLFLACFSAQAKCNLPLICIISILGGGHVLGSIPKPAVPSSVLVELLLHQVAVTLQAQGKPNQMFRGAGVCFVC